MRVTDQAALWCVVTAPLWLAATASVTSGDAEAAAAVAANARRSLIDTRSHDNGVERVGLGRRSIHHGTRSTLHHQKRLVKQHKLLVGRQSTDNSTGDGSLLGGLFGGSSSGPGSGSDTTTNPLDNTTTTPPPATTTTNNSTPTQTPNVTTTPAPAVTTTSNTTRAPATTTTTTTTNHTRVSSTPSSVPTPSSAPPTSTVTNTSQTSTSSSPSSTTTTAGDTANKSSSSSGLSKTALIIIIAVASSVGFIGLVWTIIRKTAFGTSKRFDAKLEPIEWTEPVEQHHCDETYPYGSLGANGRNGSLRGTTVGASAASLGRSDSGKGSERSGAMAEAYPHSIPYNGPAYVAAPYYGNAPANQYGARPGYPHEQASFGYADLQRGGSVATSVGSGARAATSGGYDYAAQARAMHQPPRY